MERGQSLYPMRKAGQTGNKFLRGALQKEPDRLCDGKRRAEKQEDLLEVRFEKVQQHFFEKNSVKCGMKTPCLIAEAYERVKIPERKTKGSAAYDFATPYGFQLFPGERVTIPTGIKAIMENGEVLIMAVRSSVGIHDGVLFSNGIGVIDSDYADNEQTGGDIHLALWNTSSKAVAYDAGERLAQGFFVKFDTTEDDNARGERTGGFGSTGK